MPRERSSSKSDQKHQKHHHRVKTKRVGNYILGKTLGQGTFGKVKYAQHTLVGEKVAMKILEKSKIVDVADMERVTREIAILKLLDHPNIVKLLEVIDTPKHIYLVTELASGGELFDYIVANVRLTEREACKFLHQITAAIDYCHAHSVIHRDLKPENLLLDEHKNIKMIDFGLSNMIQPGGLLGTACGSPCYASPEMIRGLQYSGPSVDIWSTGVILFALVCGYLPFEDQSTPALYDKILNARYHFPNWLSSDCRDLIRRFLTVNPAQRITISEVRSHPWYTKNYNGPADPPPAAQMLEVAPNVDVQIVNRLEEFGINPSQAMNALQSRKHNQITAAYYLLKSKVDKDNARRARRESKAALLREERKRKLSTTQPGTSDGADSDGLGALPSAVAESSESPQSRNPLDAVRAAGGRRHSVAVPALPPVEMDRSPQKRRSPMVPQTLEDVGGDRARERRERSNTLANPNAVMRDIQKAVKSQAAQETGENISNHGGAFNAQTTSAKSPAEIGREVRRVLEAHGIQYKAQSAYALICKDPESGIRFELEICRLDKFESLHVLKLKRISGDTWQFKAVSTALTQHLHL